MCTGVRAAVDKRTGETVSDRDASMEAVGLPKFSMRMQARSAQAAADRASAEAAAATADISRQAAQLRAEQVAEQEAHRQSVEALQAHQQGRLGEIRTAGQAVSTSLQILEGQGGAQGPTAAKGRRRVATPVRSSAASLRIGSTANRAGVGANLPA